MEMQNRYLVLKVEDIQHAAQLGVIDYQMVMKILDAVKDVRTIKRKQPVIGGVFIDERWPEYGHVKHLLEQRLEREAVERAHVY